MTLELFQRLSWGEFGSWLVDWQTPGLPSKCSPLLNELCKYLVHIWSFYFFK